MRDPRLRGERLLPRGEVDPRFGPLRGLDAGCRGRSVARPKDAEAAGRHGKDQQRSRGLRGRAQEPSRWRRDTPRTSATVEQETCRPSADRRRTAAPTGGPPTPPAAKGPDSHAGCFRMPAL